MNFLNFENSNIELRKFEHQNLWFLQAVKNFYKKNLISKIRDSKFEKNLISKIRNFKFESSDINFVVYASSENFLCNFLNFENLKMEVRIRRIIL